MNTFSIFPMFRNLFSLSFIGLLAFGLAACTPEPQPEPQEEVVETEFTGTMSDLMKNGEDVVCTFTRTDAVTGEMSGTVYASRGGKVRGDFSVKNSLIGDMTMHVIQDGEYGYVWGHAGKNKGLKVPIADDGSMEEQGEDLGVDEPADYVCKKWNADASMFDIPSDVEFDDLSEEIEQIQNAAGDQCGACDNIPAGPARDQCKAALKCK